jgi:hypothetical protein
MKKGVILIMIAVVICLCACKKAQPQYCYKMHEFFTEYPVTGTPADSFHVVDTTTVYCINTFHGDTTNSGTVSNWTLDGSNYFRGVSYDVYIH